MTKLTQISDNYIDIKPGITIKVLCIDIDINGHGISRDGKHVFVTPDHIVGEVAIVRVLYKKGSIWFTEKLKVLKASNQRVKPRCDVYRECGGCSIQHIEYKTQLDIKYNHLKQCLKRIANISFPINLILRNTDREFNYRNKTFIPVGLDVNGEIKMGYYKFGTHNIIDINSCPILTKHMNDVISQIKMDIRQHNIPIDSTSKGIKGLRHIGLRSSYLESEILVTLVSSNDDLNLIKKLAELWIQNFKAIKGVNLNIQPTSNNVILGNKTINIAGKSYIHEIFHGLTYRIGSTEFFQVNLECAKDIVLIIVDLITQNYREYKFLDAYCGIGTITLPLASVGIDITGVEINTNAVDSAKYNAKINGIDEKIFIEDDVSNYIQFNLEKYNFLILDPPRKGLDNTVIQAILKSLPIRIFYLSCSPATLSRDLKQLIEPNGKYYIEFIQPIDFFPQTMHLETLVLLKLINS